MDNNQLSDLLLLLKTLADKQRLTMVALMAESERTVSDMAERLQLSEPTISHHISKMHSAGLLNLRMAGNQHFYRLNAARLALFKTYATHIDSPISQPDSEAVDNAWIEALDWAEVDKKVLRDYTMNGRLTQFPTKEKKWVIILRWLATKFAPGTHYTEKEINAILREIHPDYATIRRDLVEFGFMRRERGGGNYWLAPENESAA